LSTPAADAVAAQIKVKATVAFTKLLIASSLEYKAIVYRKKRKAPADIIDQGFFKKTCLKTD
jgi:hypothetical protein